MTIDEVREQFRKEEMDANKEVKMACKAMILATLAAKLFEPSNHLAAELDIMPEQDELVVQIRQRQKAVKRENILRAVELADQLANAAFGGN